MSTVRKCNSSNFHLTAPSTYRLVMCSHYPLTYASCSPIRVAEARRGCIRLRLRYAPRSTATIPRNASLLCVSLRRLIFDPGAERAIGRTLDETRELVSCNDALPLYRNDTQVTVHFTVHFSSRPGNRYAAVPFLLIT